METNNLLLVLVGVVVCLIGYYLSITYAYELQATYVVKKKNARYGPVVSKETLGKEKFFVSKQYNHYTNKWSEVRKFSFWGAVFYCLLRKELTMRDEEMEVLLDGEGEAHFL